VLTLSKKSNTSSSFFKKFVLKHLEQLEIIAEKRFVDPNLTQESIMYALEKLEEKNWLADSYNNGSSRFTTYLITVFKNILEDVARMKFGRPQVPKWVKAQGTLWVEIYQKLCIEQIPITDIEYSVSNCSKISSVVQQAISSILDKAKQCLKERRNKYEGTIFDETTIVDEKQLSAQERIEMNERVHIMNAIYLAIISNNTVDINGSYELKTLISKFRSKVQLSSKDKVFLKLIYQEGLTISEAGKMTFKFNKNQSNSKHRQLKQKIVKLLNETGLFEKIKELI